MGCPGKIRVETYLSPEEHYKVKKIAGQCGLSMSAFVKSACLNREIKSSLDADLIGELIKVAADQGRLGGLLKLGFKEGLLDDVRSSVNNLISILHDNQTPLEIYIDKLMEDF
ncbi:MAG: conjugal transfer protein TraJ [Deltaproteobacteria bacterium]|jgi:hypothetical protein|nr:conjugal transfer protein TraJ [Deltaproteobacteria bacterium]